LTQINKKCHDFFYIYILEVHYEEIILNFKKKLIYLNDSISARYLIQLILEFLN